MNKRQMFFCWMGLTLATPHLTAAPIVEQHTLQPGWNAVYLQVEPGDPSPAAVFDHPAIEQVWTESVSGTSTQFITNINEPDWNVKAGLRFVPASRPDSFVTNLYSILGNTGYLVKVSGAAPVNLSVTGEPSLRPVNWRANSFTLSGLSLDPGDSISVGDYFLNSPPHSGQKLLTLNSSGNWIEPAPSTVAAPGKAYWVFSTSGSTHEGPLRVQPPNQDGILFAGEITSADVTLENLSAVPMQVTLTNTESLPLVYKSYDPLTGAIWPAFSNFSITLGAFETRILEIGIRKSELNGAGGGNIAIAGGGCRKLLPVLLGNNIEGTLAVAGGSPPSPSPANTTSPYAGLWIGQVLVDQVAFVNDGNPANRTLPVPTESSFPLRLLVHFTNSGAARLLGQVTVMKTGEGDDEEFVLITDSSLLGSYEGATVVDGEPFGYRISALGFDTVDSAGVAMTGNFATGLTTTLTIGKSDAVNPYKHRYHPDHDGLNPFYQPFNPEPTSPILQELWDITRTITLTVPPVTLDQTQPPGASESSLRGVYSETVTGMHKRPLHSSGGFVLNRLVKIPVLNPQP